MGSADRSFIVTGASSGLGAAIARALALSGARVLLTARGREQGEAVAASIRGDGGDVRFEPHDVADEAQWQRVIDTALGAYGRLDGVVNNAGIASTGPIESFDADEMRRILRTNLLGGMLGTRLGAQAMKDGGVVVNVASVAGRRGYAWSSAYCASKGALCAYTRAAAIQLRSLGLRVHLVIPGFYDTPLGRREAMPTPEIEAMVLAGVPLRRAGQPPELAATVAWLASAAAARFTGVEIAVDGGVLA